MDLIFNSPIKRHLRSARAQALYTSLKSWKLDLSLLKKGQPKPPFDPPMLTDVDGIMLVSEAMRKFTRDDFVLSVRKVFVDVGLAPKSNGHFVVFTRHTKPSVALKVYGRSEPPNKSTSALDILVKEVEVEPCDFRDDQACRALFDKIDADAALEDSDGEGAMGDDDKVSADGGGGAAADSGAGGGGSGAQSILDLFEQKLDNGTSVFQFLRTLGLITRSGELTANCPYDLTTAEETMVSAGLLMALTRAGVFKE